MNVNFYICTNLQKALLRICANSSFLSKTAKMRKDNMLVLMRPKKMVPTLNSWESVHLMRLNHYDTERMIFRTPKQINLYPLGRLF